MKKEINTIFTQVVLVLAAKGLISLDVEYIGGDGQTESNITNRLGNQSQYDAYAINMVKTDNATSYPEPLGIITE